MPTIMKMMPMIMPLKMYPKPKHLPTDNTYSTIHENALARTVPKQPQW